LMIAQPFLLTCKYLQSLSQRLMQWWLWGYWLCVHGSFVLGQLFG